MIIPEIDWRWYSSYGRPHLALLCLHPGALWGLDPQLTTANEFLSHYPGLRILNFRLLTDIFRETLQITVTRQGQVMPVVYNWLVETAFTQLVENPIVETGSVLSLSWRTRTNWLDNGGLVGATRKARTGYINYNQPDCEQLEQVRYLNYQSPAGQYLPLFYIKDRIIMTYERSTIEPRTGRTEWVIDLDYRGQVIIKIKS